MNTTKQPEVKPAYFKGFLWFAFSGTAMLSAFVLPVTIFVLMDFSPIDFKENNLIVRLFFVVVFLSALYHGLYRTKTILFDLGCMRHQKTIAIVATIIFLIGALLTLKLFFFSF